MAATVTSRIRWLVAALLIAPLVVLAPAQPAGAIGVAADTGAVVTAEQWIVSGRVLDLTIQSPNTDNATRKVRLILPDGWSKDAEQTWPSLYLLHGGIDDYKAWDAKSNLRTLSQGEDAIMVMPDTSWCSAYSNWWNNGNYGRPQWETWITTEVRQILERNYRANTTRGVVGNSMGGLGAMKFAANHNPMFKVAASFSGDVDTLRSWPGASGVSTPGLGCNPLGNYWKNVWGDPAIPAQRAIWEANNPYTQAHKLEGVSLFLGAGTGSGDALPLAATQHLASRLDQLGIPVTTNYISGGHDWTNWTSQLTTAWPQLMAGLEEPVPPADDLTGTVSGPGGPIEGASVRLYTTTSSVRLATAFTGADGSFTFEGLAPDEEYRVYVVDPSGAHLPAWYGGRNWATATGLAPGATVAVVLTGTATLGGLSGTVTGGGQPVAGATVRLYDAEARVVASATTADDGGYTFTNVEPGERRVLVIDPSGDHVSPRWVGGQAFRTATAFSVVAGGTVTGADVDLVPTVGLGRIEGSVTVAGEAGESLRVTLYNESAQIVATTLTASDGSYAFGALEVGTYFVRVRELATHADAWWDGGSSWRRATPVPVGPGATVAGITIATTLLV